MNPTARFFPPIVSLDHVRRGLVALRAAAFDLGSGVPDAEARLQFMTKIVQENIVARRSPAGPEQ